MTSFADRLAAVRSQIADACRLAGRAPSDVGIVAVSKTQPAAAVAAAIAAGVEAIGENRVQEAIAKRLGARVGPPWHLIGPLQRNKARQALDTFDLIETVDRNEIADRLEVLLAPASRVVPVFLEINVGGEEQKSGVTPGQAPLLVDHIVAACPHLALTGVMTVPQYDPDPERSRPVFAALRVLGEDLARRAGAARFELSMGMSEDFPVAVQEGATLVRLGRVLFGERGHA